MISSFAISVVFFVLKKTGHAQPFAHTVLYSVAFTTLSLAGRGLRHAADEPRAR